MSRSHFTWSAIKYSMRAHSTSYYWYEWGCQKGFVYSESYFAHSQLISYLVLWKLLIPHNSCMLLSGDMCLWVCVAKVRKISWSIYYTDSGVSGLQMSNWCLALLNVMYYRTWYIRAPRILSLAGAYNELELDANIPMHSINTRSSGGNLCLANSLINSLKFQKVGFALCNW